jgi:hypothetical protein
VGDIAGSFQFLDFDLGGPEGLDGLVDEFGGFGLCLRTDDLGSLELLVTQDDELLHLGQLLLDSLLFDGTRVLWTEAEVHETHVLNVDVEFLGTGEEAATDLLADLLAGLEELVSVV